jgi:ABC-type glycerol-3-phosphate transport system permease component
MSEAQRRAGDATAERDNTRLYAGVIVIEVIVVVAIWLFQRYFGS